MNPENSMTLFAGFAVRGTQCVIYTRKEVIFPGHAVRSTWKQTNSRWKSVLEVGYIHV